MALLSTTPTLSPRMLDIFEPNSILIGVEIALGIVGLVGNLLVALAILRSKSLHSLTHYFLLNLAIADSLVCITGIISMQSFFVYGVSIQDNVHLLKVAAFIFFKRSFIEQSVLSLLLVTFERYIGIVHALCHRRFFTRRKIILFILFVWVTPLIVETLPWVWLLVLKEGLNFTESVSHFDDQGDFVYEPFPGRIIFVIVNSLLLFAGPATAMIWMYIQILKDLKQSARRRQNLGMQGCSPVGLPRARQRLTHTLLLVTAAFLALILPEKVIYLHLVLMTNFEDPSKGPFGIALQCTLILSLINSAVNPVLYGLRYDRFREAIVSTFCCQSNSTANRNTPYAQMNIQPISSPELRKHETSTICYESSV